MAVARGIDDHDGLGAVVMKGGELNDDGKITCVDCFTIEYRPFPSY